MKAIVVGGSNGIGLAFVQHFIKCGYTKVYIIDKSESEYSHSSVEFIKADLTDFDFDIFNNFRDVSSVVITAGFGRPALFETFVDKEIDNGFRVNTIAAIKIIKRYYNVLKSNRNINFIVMGSIAGLVSSPMFSVYAATKAALSRFIESVNIELENEGTDNRILNVSPGSLKGTRFNGGDNQVELLSELVEIILKKAATKETLYIPQYDEVYQGVLTRYHNDAHQFGMESYEYKKNSGRINNKPQIKVGYLSGTFDLFHIGHLNLLRRAKQYCDYLVVGVHKDASHKGKQTYISFEQRAEIVKSIKYVDQVIESKPEDTDVYDEIKYDYLFVGSDYKGTERFNRYEKYFSDKGVSIIYFPYTSEVSSTELRAVVDKDDISSND